MTGGEAVTRQVVEFRLSPARSAGLQAPLAVARLGVALGLDFLACGSVTVFDRMVESYLARAR